ncbi:MAG TPA: ABC transporter permease [Rhabdochlamydiaceae bacterium]|jgi:ABC-2 type transport system permease protein|nr:ABC transporter permease [Rhabdochlamydiaceae bacterium]
MESELTRKLIAETKTGRARRMRALMVKEFYQIIRDPSSILITVFLPLLLIFLYGSGVSLDLNHLRVGLVMEDTAPDVQSFAKSLIDSTYFDVKIVRDRRELGDDIISGAIRGIFIVPSYFTQYRNRPDQMAPIQVIADGSETNTANFVQNYAQGVFANWLTQEAISGGLKKELPLITTQPRFWYNEQLESRFFLLSGSLAIIMTLIGSLLTALVVAREWERGTMEALMSTTVGIGELVMAKVIPYFCLGMISMIICVSLSIFFYDLPLRGSFLVLLLVSALFLFCALSLGLMISTLTKNQIFAYQITLVSAFLPAYILSGFLFEIHSMPKWIQLLTYIIPAKYFVQSLQSLFLVGNVWPLLLYDMIPIVGIGLIFFLITASKTAKRLD